MIFKLTLSDETQDHIFYYDNITSHFDKIIVEDFDSKELKAPNTCDHKSSNIRTLKISLGLSCNYECTYCSQRFVPHADSTNPRDVEEFVEQLPTWFDGGSDGLGKDVKVEFWGGEPLVYWKTLKPLAEAIKQRYPNVLMSIVTNGSMLNQEINDWLIGMDFGVGISHDGEHFSARGTNPLDVPEQRTWIYDLFRRLSKEGRISMNAMVHRDNQSRLEIAQYLYRKFGNNLQIGEGGFVDAYDEGGISQSLASEDEMKRFAANAFEELGQLNPQSFQVVGMKVGDFLDSIKTKRNAYTLGQKCGMDSSSNIAVDLHGNILTCQNVSAAATAPNGKSHKIGHVSDLKGAKLDSARHWSTRKECVSCPVLQLCKGACMFLEGKLWEISCNNAYFDNVAFFAFALKVLTGMKLVSIETCFDADKTAFPENRIHPFDYSAVKNVKTIPIVAI